MSTDTELVTWLRSVGVDHLETRTWWASSTHLHTFAACAEGGPPVRLADATSFQICPHCSWRMLDEVDADYEAYQLFHANRWLTTVAGPVDMPGGRAGRGAMPHPALEAARMQLLVRAVEEQLRCSARSDKLEPARRHIAALAQKVRATVADDSAAETAAAVVYAAGQLARIDVDGDAINVGHDLSPSNTQARARRELIRTWTSAVGAGRTTADADISAAGSTTAAALPHYQLVRLIGALNASFARHRHDVAPTLFLGVRLTDDTHDLSRLDVGEVIMRRAARARSGDAALGPLPRVVVRWLSDHDMSPRATALDVEGVDVSQVDADVYRTALTLHLDGRHGHGVYSDPAAAFTAALLL